MSGDNNSRQRDGDGPVAVRNAVAHDVAAIAAIWHRGWLDGHHGHVPTEVAEQRTIEDFTRRALARLPATRVATAGDQVVGMVVVIDDEVEQIYVDNAARGTGVAPRLLADAESSIAHDHATAWLAVVAGNTRARRFYERNGWCDAAAIDYQAEGRSTDIVIAARRYEKALR